jgi:PAS domain S-box-containing protein
LIVYEVNPTYPAISLIDQGIRTALETSSYEVEIYREYLDTILFPDAATQQEMRDFYIRKYRNRRPEVIITAGPGSLRFMMESREMSFPGVPVVFCLPNGLAPGITVKRPGFVGIENDIAPAETLEAALKLEPATKQVVVVGGVSAFDRQEQSVVRERLEPYEKRLDISYWTDFAMPDLLQRLQHLPSHTIVLLTTVGQDAAGTRFASSQTGPLVVGAANAPVFSLADVYLNHGEIGGDVSNIREEGQVAGSMALRILEGERPENISTVNGVRSYTFDWRALRRWGLSEKNLPPGSVVLNQPASFWQMYGRYIIPAIVALLAQALAILALLLQRAKKKKTAAELRESRLRLAGIIESAMDAIISVDEDQRVVLFNAAAEKMFGCVARNAIGSAIDRFIPERFRGPHSEHIRYVADTGTAIRAVGLSGVLGGLRSDGQEFPIEVSFSQMESAGRRLFTVIIRDVTERHRAQEALKKSEQRSRELVLRSPVAMMVIRGARNETEIINHEFTRVFGYSIGDVPDEAHWWLLAYPDETYREAIKAEWQERVNQATRNRMEIEPVEARVQCKDGGSRHVEFHFASLGDGALVSFIDFTDRQLAEEALRESEERFRLVANAAPVMIWMSGPHKLCDYFNQTWLDFTGRSLEAELGNGWAEGVYSDDLQNCWSIYTGAFDQRKPFAMEYRLRRHDGEYRWVLDLGVPRFNADRSFAGYIGSAIDVTERKEAEEALSSVSRRLIEAHEEERTWIARELHDDINQRIALLAVQLRTLKQNLCPTDAQAGRALEEAYEHVSELGSDIQALSHHLHSSKLDYLGLVAAAKSVCKELSNEQNVEIAFQSEDVPRDLPKEVSLCLFRVLQEALQNGVKHSRSRRFEVSVTATLTEIQLSVHDSGIGFDPETVVSDHGLGLTSMKERLKLVGGWLSVESKLEQGTTVHARVPLGRKRKAAGATG